MQARWLRYIIRHSIRGQCKFCFLQTGDASLGVVSFGTEFGQRDGAPHAHRGCWAVWTDTRKQRCKSDSNHWDHVWVGTGV